MNNIKEKIKNLLDLSKNNSNQNEAIAAACKARELMLKYNIEISEDDSEQVTEKVVEKRVIFSTLKLQHHHLMIASLLASNFRCKTFYSEQKIHFMGLEEDADAAVSLMEYTVKRIELDFKNFLKEDKKKYPSKYKGQGATFSKAVKRNWIQGFIGGLARAFDDQNKKDTKYELMTVIPTAVSEAYSQKSFKKGSAKGHQGSDLYDRSAWEHGYKTGKDSLSGRSLEDTSAMIEGA